MGVDYIEKSMEEAMKNYVKNNVKNKVKSRHSSIIGGNKTENGLAKNISILADIKMSNHN